MQLYHTFNANKYTQTIHRQTHTQIGVQETAIIKTAHWTELQNDFNAEVNYRNHMYVFKNVF